MENEQENGQEEAIREEEHLAQIQMNLEEYTRHLHQKNPSELKVTAIHERDILDIFYLGCVTGSGGTDFRQLKNNE